MEDGGCIHHVNGLTHKALMVRSVFDDGVHDRVVFGRESMFGGLSFGQKSIVEQPECFCSVLSQTRSCHCRALVRRRVEGTLFAVCCSLFAVGCWLLRFPRNFLHLPDPSLLALVWSITRRRSRPHIVRLYAPSGMGV